MQPLLISIASSVGDLDWESVLSSMAPVGGAIASLSGGRLIKHKVLTCKRDPPPLSKVLDLSLRKFSLTEIWFWFNFFIRRKQTQYGNPWFSRWYLVGACRSDPGNLATVPSWVGSHGRVVSKPVGANGSTHELIE
jgi:hypothetical protein